MLLGRAKLLEPDKASIREAALGRLRAVGRGLAFVTNNSSRTPEDVADHLSSLGVTASADEVETSALVTASLLGERGIATAFVVGELGLVRALQERGIQTIEGEPDSTDVVVVGLDRSADYAKLRTGSLL